MTAFWLVESAWKQGRAESHGITVIGPPRDPVTGVLRSNGVAYVIRGNGLRPARSEAEAEAMVEQLLAERDLTEESAPRRVGGAA